MERTRSLRTFLRGGLAPLLALSLLALLWSPVLAGDPVGEETLAQDPSAPVNFTWTLVAAFLVFFMQAGFALLGAGLIRSKNTVNYLTKSFMDFVIASLSYWAFGFALMFGGSALFAGLSEGNALVGYSGFFLAGEAYDVGTLMFWLFQMVFAATAATIVAGAMAERTRLQAYLAYSFLLGALIYPIYGHWIWGGGWLSRLPFGAGAVDFAGSGVVHGLGGFLALVGAWMVGPRKGKFRPDGTPNPLPAHNLVYVVLGTFILFFGWFGFNGGSTLAATDLRIAAVVVNTFLAGATGAAVAFYTRLIRTGKADLVMACNGALAGLVAITAGAAYVAPWSAVVIGAIGALVMVWATGFVERKLRVDDPVGAIACHGFAGVWGLLAVGIFADGTYGGVAGLVAGEIGQLVAQVISAAVLVAWALGTGLLLFWVLKRTLGLRVSPEEEEMGLDLTEHGLPCYGEEVPLRQPAGD